MRLSYHLISACLLGINSRYDGTNRLHSSLWSSLQNKSLLLVCPERWGGLSVPRLPARIIYKNPKRILSNAGKDILKRRARVLLKNGQDVTRNFIHGANRIKRFIKPLKIKAAYMKSKSPSCGYRGISSFELEGGASCLVKGDGVLVAVLKNKRIKIISV